MPLNKNQSKMKHIKFLIAIALVSVIAISCKETPKVEEVAPAVEEVVAPVVEEVEVAVDSLATATEEVIDEVIEAVKE